MLLLSPRTMAMRPSFSLSATPVTKPPLRPIPGSYGPPVIGPLKDRLDYFWFQGPETFFRRRAAEHRSTVFRTNMPPTFPFFVGIDPRVVAVVDCAAFTALFDADLVDKRDVLVGPYTPSTAFTGGTRVGVYLDTTEPQHARMKAFVLHVLRRSARAWVAEFLAAADAMLASLEADLAGGAKSANFLFPLQKCIFTFLCKSVVGADPAAEPDIDKLGFAILDEWLALQLLPTQKVGALPQPLEELLLHSFPLPFFLVKPGYDKLYSFVEKHGAVLAIAEGEYGLGKAEAINNILFVLGFNAFGGFSVFLPGLITTIGRDKTGLQEKLRDEVRRVLESRGDGELGFEAVKQMPLLRSAVYEVLRLNPPVPLQFGRARRDFVLRSHDAAYDVARGELLCGFLPLAMRDPAVFERPEEFVPDRFVGEAGERLLQYVYWSNGRETAQPSTDNKQCAAKDHVVATACMLIADLCRRYDKFECDDNSPAFTKLEKAKPRNKS